jgi:hypothetical protein
MLQWWNYSTSTQFSNLLQFSLSPLSLLPLYNISVHTPAWPCNWQDTNVFCQDYQTWTKNSHTYTLFRLQSVLLKLEDMPLYQPLCLRSTLSWVSLHYFLHTTILIYLYILLCLLNFCMLSMKCTALSVGIQGSMDTSLMHGLRAWQGICLKYQGHKHVRSP